MNVLQQIPQNFSILHLLKNELIGKPIRICTYVQGITSPVLVQMRKSGCTDKQWKENPEKFCVYVSNKKYLGYHAIFENTQIKDILIEDIEFMDWTAESVFALTESGHKVELPLKESINIFDGRLDLSSGYIAVINVN